MDASGQVSDVGVIMVIMITTYVDFCSIYFILDSDPVVISLFPQQRLTVVPSVAALSVGRESGLPVGSR